VRPNLLALQGSHNSGRPPLNSFSAFTLTETALLLFSIGSLALWLRMRLRAARAVVGYQAIAQELAKITKLLYGSVVRYNGEITFTGAYKNRCCDVRISDHDQQPGVVITLHTASTFELACSYSRAMIPIDETAITTTDEQLFACARDATLAKMFLNRENLRIIKMACSGGKVGLSFERGKIELSAAAFPPVLAAFVRAKLDHMTTLAVAAENMPSRGNVKVPSARRFLLRPLQRGAAVMAAVVFIVLAIVHQTVEARAREFTDLTTVAQNPLDEFSSLPGMQNWRKAEPNEWDPQFTAWLVHRRQHVAARIELDSDGAGSPGEVAFFLIGQDGSRRVAIMAGHKLCYDSVFTDLRGIAKIPNATIHSTRWAGNPQLPADERDGLLMVTGADSALIFFVQDCTVYSAVPQDYRATRF